MKGLRYLSSVRRELWFMLTIAVGVYFGVDEAGTVLGSGRVARFLSMLSASSIAAFVFYFVDVHIRTERETQKGMFYALPIVQRILGAYSTTFDRMLKRLPSSVRIYKTHVVTYRQFQEQLGIEYKDSAEDMDKELNALIAEVHKSIDQILLANIVVPDRLQNALMEMHATIRTALNSNAPWSPVVDEERVLVIFSNLLTSYRLLHFEHIRILNGIRAGHAKRRSFLGLSPESDSGWHELTMVTLVTDSLYDKLASLGNTGLKWSFFRWRRSYGG